eukprot:5173624-Pleurochrysis_carterae.AAC.1
MKYSYTNRVILKSCSLQNLSSKAPALPSASERPWKRARERASEGESAEEGERARARVRREWVREMGERSGREWVRGEGEREDEGE